MEIGSIEREVQNFTEAAKPLICMLGLLGLSGTMIYYLRLVKRRIDGEPIQIQEIKPTQTEKKKQSRPMHYRSQDMSLPPRDPVKEEKIREEAFLESSIKIAKERDIPLEEAMRLMRKIMEDAPWKEKTGEQH